MPVSDLSPNPAPQSFVDKAQAAIARMGRALKSWNFRLYIAGQLISLVGTWMQSMAQGWLVYRLSGSAIDLGVVAFAGQIPIFLLSAWGGVIADRADKRHIIIATQLISAVQALVLAGLTLSGAAQVWQVIALAALLGTANAIEIPTRQAFIVDMVGREDLPNAIALNSSIFNLGRLLGPAIGGMLVAIVGEGWCFVLNAASFVGVILCLIGMRLHLPARRLKSGPPGRALIDGLNFVRRTPPFPALFVNLATISILGLSYATLMPVMARDVLASGPEAMGILMGSSGLGALVASLNLAARQGPSGLETWPTRYAIGLGLLLALFAASRDLFVSTLIQAPIGFCFLSAVASTNTLLQSHVPDHLRGRVMSVHAFCLLGLAPFGALASGTLAHLIGAPLTIAAGGIGLSAICLIVDRSRAISNYPAPISKPASR